MISIRGIFTNKHRAYLLIFACGYLALRLPILVSSKIERYIIEKLVTSSAAHGVSTGYKNFRYNFPANLIFEELYLIGANSDPVKFQNLTISSPIGYPIRVNVEGELFKGNVSCNISKGLFSSELSVSCNSSNIETSEMAQFRALGINGPLSFKFAGVTSIESSEMDLNGEFLSQLNASKIQLPKEIPSIIKVPDLGLLDLKGNFNVKNSTIAIKDSSIASASGDVNLNLSTEMSPGFKDVVNLESLIKVKLSGTGMQTLGPWIGLALGGIQYPPSGEANIEVKGNSKAGFKGKLVN